VNLWHTLRRYLRAFIVALGMTLRGEGPPPPRPLAAWSQQTLWRLDELYAALERQGLDEAARQQMALKLDGRLMKVETVLATVKHHAAQEYPSLLRSNIEFNLAAIQAANVNDRYWLARLAELPPLQAPAIAAALNRLRAHLDAIPNDTTPPQN
jgi:hypothetical protein